MKHHTREISDARFLLETLPRAAAVEHDRAARAVDQIHTATDRLAEACAQFLQPRDRERELDLGR